MAGAERETNGWEHGADHHAHRRPAGPGRVPHAPRTGPVPHAPRTGPGRRRPEPRTRAEFPALIGLRRGVASAKM